MFIQHLAVTTHNVVKAERKPRRNIQYRDVASAVAKTDNLEFLADVVPRTVPYGEVRKRMAAAAAAAGAQGGGKVEKAKVKVNGVKARGKGKGKAAEAEAETDGEHTGAGAEEGVNGVGNGESSGAGAARNGSVEDSEKTPSAAEPMDVDGAGDDKDERVEESEPEEDGAAMQIEMEMRGPPTRANGASPAATRRTSGFTAINGSR